MSTVVKEVMSILDGISAEDVLQVFGLQRRQSRVGQTVSAIGLVGLGVVIGGVGALLLSPKNGAEIRQMLEQSIEQLKTRAKEMIPGQQRQDRVS